MVSKAEAYQSVAPYGAPTSWPYPQIIDNPEKRPRNKRSSLFLKDGLLMSQQK
jgi:hypothetical protein